MKRTFGLRSRFLGFELFKPSLNMSGLVFHLDAGEPVSYSGSGATWNDLSPTGNNVTLSGNYSYNSTTKGIVFQDGSAIGNAAGMTNIPTGTSDRTVIVITKTPTTLNQFLKHIVHWGITEPNRSWGLVANFTNLGSHRWGAGGSSVSANLEVSTVYQLAATYKHSETKESFYKNGSPIGTITVTPNTGGSQLTIGSRIAGPSENWAVNGEIYVVLIYNRCLSDIEIQQVHNYYKARFGL